MLWSILTSHITVSERDIRVYKNFRRGNIPTCSKQPLMKFHVHVFRLHRLRLESTRSHIRGSFPREMLVRAWRLTPITTRRRRWEYTELYLRSYELTAVWLRSDHILSSSSRRDTSCLLQTARRADKCSVLAWRAFNTGNCNGLITSR